MTARDADERRGPAAVKYFFFCRRYIIGGEVAWHLFSGDSKRINAEYMVPFLSSDARQPACPEVHGPTCVESPPPLPHWRISRTLRR